MLTLRLSGFNASQKVNFDFSDILLDYIEVEPTSYTNYFVFGLNVYHQTMILVRSWFQSV
jgi:hypothetical protein